MGCKLVTVYVDLLHFCVGRKYVWVSRAQVLKAFRDGKDPYLFYIIYCIDYTIMAFMCDYY
jgi:hypothetical protein